MSGPVTVVASWLRSIGEGRKPSTASTDGHRSTAGALSAFRMIFVTSVLLAGICIQPEYALSADQWTAERFDREVAPILARHCLECHSGASPEAELNLSTYEQAVQGGESGAAINAAHPLKSLLWTRVTDGEMPPDDAHIEKAEMQVLESWLKSGARWGTAAIDRFRYTSDRRAGYDWWSLQAVKRPTLPVGPEFPKGTHPIDAFVRARLKSAGLTPSERADRQVLIRRAAFDLTGLPPTPDEVRTFVESDSEDAFAGLVDRLLESPHHGERWARHWLDLARFGESQGFERDKLRPNSWRYRDWVVNALNADMPYDEFARMQIAGDVLYPDQANAVTATGFLVAGAWDEVGQSQQSRAMRAVVRQDELEDLAATTFQTFLGLTVNCARCHDHKFDPIRQSEYYQLTAALSGVRHGERAVTLPDQKQLIHQRQVRWAKVKGQLDELERGARQRVLDRTGRTDSSALVPAPISVWDFDDSYRDSVGPLHARPHGAARIESGQLIVDGRTAYASTLPLKSELAEKTLEVWVQVAGLSQRGGGVISVQATTGDLFDAIVFGEREPRHWMSGSNGFVRTKSFGGAAETHAGNEFVHVAIAYDADGTIRAYRNGQPYGQPYNGGPVVKFKKGQAEVLFGMRHGKSPGSNRMLAGRIEKAQLFDRALTAKQIELSSKLQGFVTHEELIAELSEEQRQTREQWVAELDRLSLQVTELNRTKVYAVTPRKPEPAFLLLRGNPATPGSAVLPGGIAALSGVESDFGLAQDSSDQERRTRLAQWMTSEKNPLFARVIVNRLWHYHFGQGLIETPNDFGFNGGQPTHPDLLDWLAVELIENQWSLKHIHKLILTSATWQQQSRVRPDCLERDATNRMLWRHETTRLEAEAIRDSILAVSGQLNRKVGGPPYRDFTTSSNNSQFYKIIDPVGPEYHRRTLYRTWIRSGRNWFLDVFDCPDPSTTAPQRAVTTTPVQSLALMNNSFVLRMADRLAERVREEVGAEKRGQIRRMFELAYSRDVTDAEVQVATDFVSDHGLSALARVLFNSNEFLYVD